MKKVRLLIQTLIILCILIFAAGGCSSRTGEQPDSAVTGVKWEDLKVEHSMKLLYAEQFHVDYLCESNGQEEYPLITIEGGDRFLVVPENTDVPEGIEEGVVVLKRPLDHIYLVATSAMDLFRVLDGIGNIRLSGTDADGWYIEEAKQALEDGKMVYAGKYSRPDYELILSEDCDLAVESTMIYHTPEVKEQMEEFDIPVLVERSSYESHPLGRMEWLKLYGVLLGKEKEAEEYFASQIEKLQEVLGQENTGKTVAFFYITSNGYANVRKSGDYVAKMIEMAGGTYIFQNLGDEENALSTMNMEMESFYSGAKDADYIIYNSTIDGEIKDMEQLLSLNELLSDFKAVKEGRVWCTKKNMFQESTGMGDMILDIHNMITGDSTEFTYLYPLK